MPVRTLVAAAVLATAAVSSATDPPAERTIAYHAQLITTFATKGIPFRAWNLPDANERAVAFTDTDVKNLFEALEGDRRANVTAAPRIDGVDGKATGAFFGRSREFTTGVEVVVRDGRVVVAPKVTVVDEGETYEFTGRVTADGGVTGRVKYTNTQLPLTIPTVPVEVPVPEGGRRTTTVRLQSPRPDRATLDATFAVPADGYVVIPGPTLWREYEVEVYYGGPLLELFPALSRRFRTVGVERQEVRTFLVLTTAVTGGGVTTPAPRQIRRFERFWER